jgi:uncharacterized protein
MVIECLSPDGITPLWCKSQIEHGISEKRLPDWVGVSYSAFVETIGQENFPCFFGTIAEQREMIRYAIAPSFTEADAISHTLEAIYKYLDEEKIVAQNPGEDSFFLTLVIFFPPGEEGMVEDYAAKAWAFLNSLHQLDSAPWPSDLPTDPYAAGWRYFLGGRSLFVNICTPAHQKRRSRHLGPGMTFVINPADLFEKLWEKKGEQPRREIYRRVEHYDNLTPYPLFFHEKKEEDRTQSYGLVYIIPEDNNSEPLVEFHYQPKGVTKNGCPFHSHSSSDVKPT